MAKIIAMAFGGALLLVASACRVPSPSAGEEHPGAALVKIIVEPEQRAAAFNYEGQFQPHAVTVTAGGKVTWNNTDNKEHTVVSYDGLFDRRLRPGQVFHYTFSQNGSFKYHCILHDGMDGYVYVQ